MGPQSAWSLHLAGGGWFGLEESGAYTEAGRRQWRVITSLLGRLVKVLCGKCSVQGLGRVGTQRANISESICHPSLSWRLQTYPMAPLFCPQGQRVLGLKWTPPWVVCEAGRWA